MPVAEFIAQSSQQFVRVRTLLPSEFCEAMQSNGATVVKEDDGALSVAGLNAQEIGDIAFERRLPLHELSPQLASLEEAFMELTQDSVDYRGEAANPAVALLTLNNDRHTPAGK
jgi:ABC-2 type transport system ATP-binding protein